MRIQGETGMTSRLMNGEEITIPWKLDARMIIAKLSHEKNTHIIRPSGASIRSQNVQILIGIAVAVCRHIHENRKLEIS